MTRPEWLPQWVNETFLIIVIPALFVVSLITALMIFGFQEPVRGAVSLSTTLEQRQLQYNVSLRSDAIENEYSVNDPHFVLNPFEISPLTGLLVFKTEEVSSYFIEIVGKLGSESILYQSAAEDMHYIPVYGLYPDYYNSVNIYENNAGVQGDLISTVYVKTDPLPDTVEVPTSFYTTSDYFMEDWMLLIPSVDTLPVAIDANGDVRWYSLAKYSYTIQPLNNGHFLVGGDRLLFSPDYVSRLWEVDLLGKIHGVYEVPRGFHHDVEELPNGNFLIATNGLYDAVGDTVIEMDRVTGDVIDWWYMSDYRPLFDPNETIDTAHTNWFDLTSISYDPVADDILVNSSTLDIVLNINRTSHRLNYIIGDAQSWDEAVVEKYFLTPIGVEFEWFYGQHDTIFVDEDTIMVFDNGNNRFKIPMSDASANTSYSQGIIYDIDRSSYEVTMVERYGAARYNEFYSPYGSNVAYYGEGHYLIHSGGIVYNSRGSLNSTPANYTDDLPLSMRSTTLEIKDGIVEYELIMPSNYYHALRISPYENVSFETAHTSFFGTQLITPKYTSPIRLKYTVFQSLPAIYQMSFVKENDRLIVSGVYNTDDVVYVELYSNEQVYRYKISASQETLVPIVVDVLPIDKVAKTLYINEADVSGTFNIFLIVNGHRYDTYEVVTFK